MLPQLISEHRTRKKLIDPELAKRGWRGKYIKEEVNCVKSDFKRKSYALFDGHVERGDLYADYVLLDEDNSVLAIIESKRFSVDEERGRIQARTYAKSIESQIDRRIPILLTNGRVWMLIDEDGVERKVSGPFSQEDLKRRGDLHRKKRDARQVELDSRIVDRPRSIQIVREMSEHFSKGHRKALVEMATGTGKTRVAMAIAKILIDANMIRNVLFIADRTALVNQAKSSGFKQFFVEPVADLREGFTTSARLYVSTVQTLASPRRNPLHRKFSPGFFDLVIFDEAHRSYYDKNNVVEKYFDAIKIGLTATPREHETRNTYDLFDCEYGVPTVEYSYDEAVRDGVLVPYVAEIIETKVLSLGIKGSELTRDLKDQLRRQEENPETVEYTGSQFDRAFMDDKTNELIIRQFMALCYRSDEGKPCKSVFFCASQRHARQVKRIFGKLFPSLSSDVQVITSEMARAEDEVIRFQLESEPRIALSVGMLDTGVDIPELSNLVFIKPVFSHIRFWQMVGRGTRNLKACRHLEWLPNRKKEDFLILDFRIGGHSNVLHHEFEASRERRVAKNVITRIFENRVKLLEKSLDDRQKVIISRKIIESIEALDENSFIVREKLPVVEKIKTNPFQLDKYLEDLTEEIGPLMALEVGTNPNVSSFILLTERAFSLILDKDSEKLEEIRAYVQEMSENILTKERSLSVIAENRSSILRILQEDFWEDLTFEDIEFIIKKIAPLMKYWEPLPRKIVQIDAADLVLSRERFEKELKEDTKLLELLERSPLARRIRDGEGVTSPELLQLEAELSALRPELTIDNIQKYQNRDFIVFLREIIGITEEEDPKGLIENRFDEYIIKNSQYSSEQLEFLLLLKKVFAERKRIRMSDLAQSPLADERPLDIFSLEELDEIVTKCNQIRIC